MKVAYLIVTRTFPGLLKQIDYDRELTSGFDDIEWEHFTFLDKVDEGEAAQQLPALFRGVFGRKLYAWLWLLKNSSKYDFVIVRHMEFDPFALLFAWFVRNRILVHHSKEVLELRLIRRGWKGYAASLLESLSGRVAVRTAKGIVGVTKEVGDYQRSYRGLSSTFPVGFFPNGVIVDNMPLLDDQRSSNIVEIAFMCGTFAQWHGLDVLLDKLHEYLRGNAPHPVKLHLIGTLNEEQVNHVKEVNALTADDGVIAHGRMKQDEYRKILGRCQIGMGSLAMYRIQMLEGATLKVRELLAMGLPLYSGHKDTALPDDFPYYMIGKGDFSEIVKYSLAVGNTPRYTVCDQSREFIDKRVWVNKLANFLRELKT